MPAASDEMVELRRQYLTKQISAMAARIRMLKGERLSFDEEARALYDATVPTLPESHFQEVLDQLEKRFPGQGPLVDRYEAYRLGVRHPEGPARPRLHDRDQRLPRADDASPVVAGG